MEQLQVEDIVLDLDLDPSMMWQFNVCTVPRFQSSAAMRVKVL